MALRVVSLPATASRMKNDAISADVSRSPSTSAATSAVVRSSRGLARRSSASAVAYAPMSMATFMNSSKSVVRSGSPKPRITLVQWKIW